MRRSRADACRIDGRCHRADHDEGHRSRVDVAVFGAVRNEDRLASIDCVAGVIHVEFAAALDHVYDFFGSRVRMACRCARIDGQPVGHHVLGAKIAINEPLHDTGIERDAVDLILVAQPSSLLDRHAGRS